MVPHLVIMMIKETYHGKHLAQYLALNKYVQLLSFQEA